MPESSELGNQRSKGLSESRRLEVALHGLSRKILFLASMLNACIQQDSSAGSLTRSNIESLSQFANLCVSEVVAISRMRKSPLRPITSNVLAQYSRFGRDVNFESHEPLPAKPSQRGPSKRELDVVKLLAGGKTNKEMAQILGLSVKTIEAYRANAMLRLGLKSVSEVALYAVRNKIIQV